MIFKDQNVIVKERLIMTGTLRTRGVALITAIGVLATLFIMVTTIAVTARIMYEKSGTQQIRAQVKLLTESGARRVRQVFANQSIVEPADMAFKVDNTEIYARISPISADNGLYTTSAINRQVGDVRAVVSVNYSVRGRGDYTATRHYLINLQGKRKGLVNLSKLQFEKARKK